VRHIKFSSKLGSGAGEIVTDNLKRPYLNVLDPNTALQPTQANKFRNLDITIEAQCSAANILDHLKEVQASRLTERREFLIAGMSNAGKSSLINSFLGEKVARVSNRPVIIV
jgi:ribosome biogenesis GTPase A